MDVRRPKGHDTTVCVVTEGAVRKEKEGPREAGTIECENSVCWPGRLTRLSLSVSTSCLSRARIDMASPARPTFALSPFCLQLVNTTRYVTILETTVVMSVCELERGR